MLSSFKRLCFIFGCSVIVATIGFAPPAIEEARASTTITTDFHSGIWTDSYGDTSRRSEYSRAPFTIDEGAFSYVFSAGYDDATVGPRLGSINAGSYTYHDFDHASLAAFRNLTTVTNEAVIALMTTFNDKKVTNINFSYLSTTNGTLDIHLIQSLNEGADWSLVASASTVGKTSITFSETLMGHKLRFGILATNTKSSYQAINNPQIQFTYDDMSDAEIVMEFSSDVLAYSPCVSDELGLLFADEQVASELSTRHNQFNNVQKIIFTGTEAYYRLALIIDKYALPISMEASGVHYSGDNYFAVILLLSSLALIGIGYGIKKRE